MNKWIKYTIIFIGLLFSFNLLKNWKYYLKQDYNLIDNEKNISLCFCVRDCEEYLPKIFKNIELMKQLNYNIYCIFVYDNCTDNSPYILDEYRKKNSNVIVREIKNQSNLRTVRIAKARNTCLQILYDELDDIEFHIMIDSDDINSDRWNINIINQYLKNFDNDNWDCITFNRNNYYDIWALLFDDYKHHCWGFGNKSNEVVNAMKRSIIHKLNNLKENSIEVISAFNGFGIYKTKKFKGIKYDGYYSNVKPLITDYERYNTIKVLKEKHGLDVEIKNTLECCEHIFYHINARRNGLKIKVSKFTIF